MIVLDEKYKVSPFGLGETYLINDRLPIHNLISFLSTHREYNYEMSDKYLKDNYDIDISNHRESLIEDCFDVTVNIYERYRKSHPTPSDYIANDRKYFNTKGRNYYLKFVNWCGHVPNKDFLGLPVKADVIHHVFPLVYGGTNELENLIHISERNHEILHLNSMEHIQKYNFQAVDYLWYLNNPFITEKVKYLHNKYNFDMLEGRSNEFKRDYYFAIIKEEMIEYYKLMEHQEVTYT